MSNDKKIERSYEDIREADYQCSVARAEAEKLRCEEIRQVMDQRARDETRSAEFQSEQIKVWRNNVERQNDDLADLIAHRRAIEEIGARRAAATERWADAQESMAESMATIAVALVKLAKKE